VDGTIGEQQLSGDFQSYNVQKKIGLPNNCLNRIAGQPGSNVIAHIMNRIIPYISLGLVSLVFPIVAHFTSDGDTKSVLLNIFSSSIFFFLAYLFYDLIRQVIINKEKKYLVDYIKNKISNDVFVALYFLKKIIQGYNLDANTLENIFSTVNYSKQEIFNSVKNQNYLGFQIFKNTDEVRSLFKDTLNDNLILKYSSHTDSISILRIANNLARLEYTLKNEINFNKCAESGIEFNVTSGKDINPDNDEGYLLLKKTAYPNRFVVYDSGVFEKDKIKNLLQRYVLKEGPSKEISDVLFETFTLMKHWLPDTIRLARNETRFRITKDFFSPNTNIRTKQTKIYVADIVDIK
jgi:hypothetical protein